MSSNFQLLLTATEDILDLKSTAVEDVTKHTLSVVGLVETLGPYLTNSDESKRLAGTSLLASVLFDLPADFLNEDEVSVLTTFFCDRLKDHFTITPAALKGLKVLSNMKNLNSLAPIEILLALSQHVTCQTLHQTSRLTFYVLMQNLMLNKMEELQKHSGDFVYAVISAMDSESDPRNLMFLFNFLPGVFKNFQFKHLVDEAFSILECYFPVDFNAKDKGSITREDLSEGLESCFISCEDFGPLIIPMVLEKLESSLKVAHLDSLKLLSKGFECWTIEAIDSHAIELWNSFKVLILPSTDSDVAEAAIKALISLIYKYSTSPLSMGQSETINQLLNDVFASTNRFLNDPGLSLFLPSIKLLALVSQASALSCRQVIKHVVPQLLVLLNYKNNHDIILGGFCPILNASIKFNFWNEENDEILSILHQIPNVIIDKLNNVQSRHECFLCLNEIILILTPEMRHHIINLMLDFIPQTTFTNRESCANFIKAIATQYPEEIKEKLLGKLNIIEDKAGAKMKLDVLCWCINVPSLMHYAIDQLINITESMSISSVALSCLRDFCENSADEVVLHRLGNKCHLVQQLLKISLHISQNNHLGDENEILMNSSKTIELIVRSLQIDEQQILISQSVPQFLSDNEIQHYSKLSSSSTILLKGLLIPLRQEVEILDCDTLIINLINNCLTCDCDIMVSSSSILLASIINKYRNIETLQTVLDQLSNILSKALTIEEQKVAATNLISWITKSLVLRGHASTNYWLDKLIELLGTNGIEMIAANGFKLILTEYEEISENNYCTIKVLYKQRIFGKLKQLIKLLDDNCEDSKKAAVSLAIAFVLQSVPKSLIIGELNELVKVIITCIESQDPAVTAAVLEVVSGLLQSGEAVFEEYIETFVPRCLYCCSSTNMAVRMWALECLFYYGKFKEIRILPYRTMVLNGVQSCLDHKKRLVRQNAVKTRTRWFLVGNLPEK